MRRRVQSRCTARAVHRAFAVYLESAKEGGDFTFRSSFRLITTPLASSTGARNLPSKDTGTGSEAGVGAGAGSAGDSVGHETVSVKFRGNEICVSRGTVLRTALLQNGLTPHNGKAVFANCRGAGLCGTCAVQIEGSVLPPQWEGQEARRMQMPPHRAPNNARLRLACSVQLDGDVRVTKYDKIWGQGDIPMEPISASNSVTPFGDLEFVLDSRKKTEKPK